MNNAYEIPGNTLTPREREVVSYVTQGLSNQQIADKLCLSERTVRTHVSNILLKTGMSNRTEIALHFSGRNMPKPPVDVLASMGRIVKAVQQRDVFGFLQDDIQQANQWLRLWSDE